MNAEYTAKAYMMSINHSSIHSIQCQWHHPPNSHHCMTSSWTWAKYWKSEHALYQQS